MSVTSCYEWLQLCADEMMKTSESLEFLRTDWFPFWVTALAFSILFGKIIGPLLAYHLLPFSGTRAHS
jgi:hypothetical protein